MEETYRIGEAARALGVRVETLRRWEDEGRLRTIRTAGGQRRIPAAELARLLAERRERDGGGGSRARQSVRNHFPGVIVAVNKDRAAATVEIIAGPHRILSLLTREAADELGLRSGMRAIASVKATNVSIELARGEE
jgi:molybdopterin-binding protein